MTILGPLLMASAFLVPVLIAHNTDDKVVVEVIDEAGMDFKNSEKIDFEKANAELAGLLRTLAGRGLARPEGLTGHRWFQSWTYTL